MGHWWAKQRNYFRALGGFLGTLSLILGLQGVPPLLAQDGPFSTPPPPIVPVDIQSHWAVGCITTLAETGMIRTVDGRFYPDEPILWGDYVMLLNRLVPPGAPGGWANPLEQALGLTTAPTVAGHYPSQYYQPDRPLVRAEGIMALAAKLGANHEIAANTLINNNLQDGRQVPSYAREGVAAALAQGVVVNYPQADQLNPTRRLTRGEAAALVCRASTNPLLRQQIDAAWVATAQRPAEVPALNPEMRGVWLTNIDSQVLFSKDALATAVDQLAALNFNTLYPTVWNWGYTLYPSPTAQRQMGIRQHLYANLRAPSPAANTEERDMLQEAIELGHAKGMAVIPWFEFGFMAPANYELYRRHPDWFTQKQVVLPIPETLEPAMPDLAKAQSRLGTSSKTPTIPRHADSASREKQRVDHWLAQGPRPDLDPALLDDPGIWMEGGVIPRRWLNPFHPQVQKFLLELINDLMSNYEVDGFQFDDHLGLPVEFGYDPYTINLYRAEHNGQSPPSNPQDKAWVAWRANKISDFLAEVYKLVKARRPQAVMSISPNPYPFAYVTSLQDWPTWVNRGLVDELVVQVYRSDQNRFIWEINKPSLQAALRKIPTSAGILSGLRATPVGMGQIGDQIKAVRDRRLSGMSFFFYESLWIPPATESRDDRITGLQQAFASPASRPGV